jgi:hypothetical protein
MHKILVTFLLSAFLCSCATEEPEKKPVPPASSSSKTAWNKPVSGQGGGAFSALPQQPRR